MPAWFGPLGCYAALASALLFAWLGWRNCKLAEKNYRDAQLLINERNDLETLIEAAQGHLKANGRWIGGATGFNPEDARSCSDSYRFEYWWRLDNALKAFGKNVSR